MATNAKKILIAEDEKSIAKVMQLKLQKNGFEVDTTGNGEEAIAALKAKSYDLLLLDLMMPKVDGFGVLEFIKKSKIKTKVIVTSNLSQEEDIQKSKELGAIDYLVKSDTPIQKIIEKVSSFA